nr:EOG090X0FH3 [Triops cancriformis]
MNGSFRVTVWDPPLIISQICAMQAIMYVSLGTGVLVLHMISGHPISLDALFRYEDVQVKEVGGRLLVAVFLLNSLICALALWIIVQRRKMCLDFTATVHFLHLIFCWFYNGLFPTSAAWWLVQVICVTITCVCAEFLCLRSEMKAIPLGLGSRVDL